MTARIKPGELGHITVRPRGTSWTAQANGRDLADIKRTVYGTGATEKEARKAIRQIWKGTSKASGQTLGKHATIADAKEVWLKEKKGSVSHASHQTYINRGLNLCQGIGKRPKKGEGRKVFDRIDGVGAMQLRRITRGWVREYIFSIRTDHGDAAAWAMYATLRAVLHVATIHDAIPTNPASRAISEQEMPSKRDVRPLSREQFKVVWSALDGWGVGNPRFRADKERLQFLLKLGLLAALRCGEALAVRDEDVRDGVLYIRGTIVQPPDGPAFRQQWTKTGTESEIELTPALAEVFEQRRALTAANDEGLFVASRTGQPVPVVNVGRTLRIFAKQNEDIFREMKFPIESFTFHVLRRSAATYVENLLGKEAASSLLTHSGTGSLKHYVVPSKRVNADATMLVNDFFE